MLAQGPSPLEVDRYRKYKPGQSLYNPEKLGELGTQIRRNYLCQVSKITPTMPPGLSRQKSH